MITVQRELLFIPLPPKKKTIENTLDFLYKPKRQENCIKTSDGVSKPGKVWT